MEFGQFYLLISWDGHGFDMLKYFFSEIRFLNDEWMNKWASPSSRGARLRWVISEQSEKR